MKVKKVICSKALTGFYMDDKQAIKAGAKSDGFVYKGEPVTPGFKSIRQPGVAVSVMFVLEDGKISGIGKHKDLLKSNEVYREIALSQLSEEELA